MPGTGKNGLKGLRSSPASSRPDGLCISSLMYLVINILILLKAKKKRTCYQFPAGPPPAGGLFTHGSSRGPGDLPDPRPPLAASQQIQSKLQLIPQMQRSGRAVKCINICPLGVGGRAL